MHRYNIGLRTAEKLLLFRRHGKDCEVHRIGLSGSAKRYYMDCDCTIWVVGGTPTQPTFRGLFSHPPL
jgi:hypothetical protein